jgi:hypothetical protein
LLLLVGKKPYAFPDTAIFETGWPAKSRTPFPIQQPLKQAGLQKAVRLSRYSNL